MIPKVCSFYWGGGPLSYLQYLSIASFHRYNADWTINLYAPKETSTLEPTWFTGEQPGKYAGKDYLAEAKKLCTVVEVDFTEHEIAKPIHEVQRSDILRWYILYEQGGIWSDIDILYTKSVAPLLEIECDASVCFHSGNHYIGFFIARPQQKFYLDLYEIAKDNVRRNVNDDYQSLGSGILRYRFGDNYTIQDIYSDIRLANLVKDIVYPYLPDDVDELFFGTKDQTTPNTFGIHWYNGSPLAKKYQNSFDKYRKNKSLISKLIKEYDGV